ILEKHGKNEGRDPYPKLVAKARIPKQYFGLNAIGCSADDITDKGLFKKQCLGLNAIGCSADDITDKAYISYKDLRVGQKTNIYGRQLMLYSCDGFTRFPPVL
ncbi:hypothetical protein T484DRAFT_1832314, partial [Baffinella frigidus]